MAIIKGLSTKFGIEASYHRITAFSISYKQKKVTVCVATYLSKEARIKRSDPIEEVDIEIPYSDYPKFTESNPIETSYLWLKENVVGFESAADDFDVIEPYQEELSVDE